jgi:hypothetical protein
MIRFEPLIITVYSLIILTYVYFVSLQVGADEHGRYSEMSLSDFFLKPHNSKPTYRILVRV